MEMRYISNGEELRMRRLALRVSQTELANVAHVGQSKISRAEIKDDILGHFTVREMMDIVNFLEEQENKKGKR